MSSAQIKTILKNKIDEADDRLLNMIHAMVEAYHKSDEPFSYDTYGNPSSAAKLKEKLDQSVKDAKNGNYISLGDLKKESEEWTKPMK